MAKVKIEAGHTLDGQWIKMPLADALTPKGGRLCYGPAWWMLTAEDELLFFRRYTSPQCNSSKTLCERFMLGKGLNVPPASKVTYLETVYLPHNPADYCD